VQHFSSWKVRTIAGMVGPEDQSEAERRKLQLKVEDILIADDPDTKFCTLNETPIEGFISAWRADIEALAAVTQTPTHALTGQLVNLSAEALAAARASLTQKVYERQKTEGEAHLQALQLALTRAHAVLGGFRRLRWPSGDCGAWGLACPVGAGSPDGSTETLVMSRSA
jgi:hypothetical protein